jgi:Mrp family chromosome partitioning ATPase
MDLRNSSITEVMGLSQEETGLADLLEGKVSVGDIMIVDEKSGVAVLPGGNAGKKAVQLLSSDRPRRLLAMAREEVDYIIVDTPPIGILSDAASIVQNVDAGIFVIRQDYAPVDRILEGIQMLSETGLRIVGCVLNNMDTGIVGGYGHYSRYGYGRYGGYGYGRYGRYGYGYGYGSKGKKRSKDNVSDEDDDAAGEKA